MNGDMALELAEERLLSAVLAELAREPRAGVLPGWSVGVRAALVLLGVAVAFATAWYVRTDRDTAAPPEVQEPQPLPPPTRVEGGKALEKLLRDAPGTRNLWAIVQPADLNVVAEFVHVERLLLEPFTPPSNGPVAAPQGWNLLPLTRLGRLRSVTIGYCEGVAVEEIARLAALPGLREFGLIGTVHTFDAAMGKVLHGMSLRRVSLEAVRVAPAGFDALVALSGLEHLEFGNCIGLDGCDLARLGKLQELRSLHLRGVGSRLVAGLAAGNFQGGAPPRVQLTPAVMQALAGLPDLRELVLDSSPLDAAVLAALPAQLERLGLRECLVTDDGDFRRCAALPKLRAVSCSVPELLTREQATGSFVRRQEAMCALLDRHGLDHELVWTLGARPFLTGRGALIDASLLAIRSVTGHQAKLSTSGGTSDGRFIAEICPQVIEIGPVNASIHKIDECVDEAAPAQLAAIYRHILEQLLPAADV